MSKTSLAEVNRFYVPWVLNPLARQAALDNLRLVDTGVLCRSKFARLFNSVSIKGGEICEVNCKSWRCKKHRQKWGWRWHNILVERLKEIEITLLVNLTTSEMYSHDEIHRALRRFMWRFRQVWGPTEYLRVTEYNKNHTQPHFHFLFYCPDVKFPPMPAKFREKDNKNLSYPENVYTWIMQEWGDALEYIAPDKKRTCIVWCQPPGDSVAAGKYAVNYVTGKNKNPGKDKNEEPDATWRGRKLCYSKHFFDKPASQIYLDYLIARFGQPDPTERYFWLPNTAERIQGETPAMFARVPIMAERFFQAKYYRENGFFPDEISVPDNLAAIWYEALDTGQYNFGTKSG